MKIYKVYYTDYYEVKRISYFKDLETLYTNFCVCFGALENSLGITKKELLKNIMLYNFVKISNRDYQMFANKPASKRVYM